MNRRPHPVSFLQLVEYAEGEVSDAVVTHLARCSSCQRRVRTYIGTGRRLRSALFRFDCPTTMDVCDYAIDLVSEECRVAIARHVVECSSCSDELWQLCAYLSAGLSTCSSVFRSPPRHAVATLFEHTTSSPFGIARGAEQAESSEYRAGPIRIMLGSVPGGIRGAVTVDRLLLDESAPPGAAAQRVVRLLAGDALVTASRTDDLGGFTFEAVATGAYQLQITLSDHVAVVENLPIARTF